MKHAKVDAGPVEQRLLSDLADLDEALVRATQDPRTADGVRRYYQEWLLDEPLLAPRVMLKHTAFDAFVRDS